MDLSLSGIPSLLRLRMLLGRAAGLPPAVLQHFWRPSWPCRRPLLLRGARPRLLLWCSGRAAPSGTLLLPRLH